MNGVEGLLGIGIVIVSFPAGWLYIHVAAKTVVLPTTNDGVNLKSNSATDARNDRMMARLVAKPLRILSEYLMTTAVINPPKVWIATVPHAHPPKFLNRSVKKPWEFRWLENTTGSKAGTRENKESWTFLTQRSALEPLRTISK